MMKSKKLFLARETLVLLSNHALPGVRGGAPIRETFQNSCEPSGIIACPSLGRPCPV